jgi:peptidoglycan/LPS O-acetylase OafA/YrhL
LKIEEDKKMKQKTIKRQREYYVDWLRVLAVILLFVYHTARIFDVNNDFYVKNDHLSTLLTHIVVDTMAPWYMPLFFFLAGAATWHALNIRTAVQYAGERFKRLLVPLIAGILLLVPQQTYIGLLSHSDFQESFLQYLPRFFEPALMDIPGYYLGGFTVAHLWFILYLFIFSIALLPVFLFLKSPHGKAFVHLTASVMKKRFTIFLPALLLVFINTMIGFEKNPLYYILYFFYGFIVKADRRFGTAIEKDKFVALVLGLGIHLLALVDQYSMVSNDYSAVIGIGRLFVPWLILVALMGYGKKFLDFTNRFLRYVRQASYPIYIMHQTVIVVVGYYVVNCDANLWLKFVLIMSFSILITFVLYHFVVRKFRAVGFLAGLKPHPNGRRFKECGRENALTAGMRDRRPDDRSGKREHPSDDSSQGEGGKQTATP